MKLRINGTLIRAAILAVTLGIAITPRTVLAQNSPRNPVDSYQRLSNAVVVKLRVGTLRIDACRDDMVRVRYSLDGSFRDDPNLSVSEASCSWPHLTVDSDEKKVRLQLESLRVEVDRVEGWVDFVDSAGHSLFQDARRSLVPVTINGESTYRADIVGNLWNSYEGLYGLGQHQLGALNYRGSEIDLSQENSDISVPLLLSSKGYGIFWNNGSRSRFNNRSALTLYLSAEVANEIDYYFILGPDFDHIIGRYRDLTGAVPMYGRWAYGLWQSKNRYKTQSEILAVAKKYRDLDIPVDNLVQDWYWWTVQGEPTFDAQRYPDPQGMFAELHKQHFHAMVSVWPYFRRGSATYEEMEKRGYFIYKQKEEGYTPAGNALYDAFDPRARQFYWNLIDKGLFALGADAWWLDSDEPETVWKQEPLLVSTQTALGNGARYADMFPLFHTKGVYDGQRAASTRQRVFILSRSAFAGQQQYGTTAWSGDIEASWSTFKRQIPAGLNYSMSGLPYWTTDIGGFITGNPDDPRYRELLIRWFQFGVFNPILRMHGTRDPDGNELWSYGTEAQRILTKFDSLRYRLLPYIYSLAWMTTNSGYTPMRALPMDFREDARVSDIADQFMFGPAFLVNPVTDPQVTLRTLYLPDGLWVDFWSGDVKQGGQTIAAATPLESLPLFVRAGSIVPMGPAVQWATEKLHEPIEVRVYRGAGGNFVLYEDENDGYAYEKGAYSTILFHWDDASGKLSIGERQGRFPGIQQNRQFRIVFVGPGHGVGVEAATAADVIVNYGGKAVTVTGLR